MRSVFRQDAARERADNDWTVRLLTRAAPIDARERLGEDVILRPARNASILTPDHYLSILFELPRQTEPLARETDLVTAPSPARSEPCAPGGHGRSGPPAARRGIIAGDSGPGLVRLGLASNGRKQ
jgi:hypothetical protein